MLRPCYRSMPGSRTTVDMFHVLILPRFLALPPPPIQLQAENTRDRMKRQKVAEPETSLLANTHLRNRGDAV